MASSSSSSSTPSAQTDQPQCPVDHETRLAWIAAGRSAPHPMPEPVSSSPSPSSSPAAVPGAAAGSSSPPLPTDRVTSSIPRTDSPTNWVYPSQSQFFSAMSRKHSSGAYSHPPNAGDMEVVVPIHNAVNERAWGEVLRWERGRGGEMCGGVRLSSFVGKPRERTWRAWGRVLLGYQAPFDRHDWIVDRCGHRIRYIIDFYTGRPPSSPSPSPSPSASASPSPSSSTSSASATSASESTHPMKHQGQETGQERRQVSFFLDVRPAPDTLEGVGMQLRRMWDDFWGR